ncbi:MAG TPA: thiamine-binding protein [Acidimicrobiales bacterium]|nr:thiamine-binding protein [Acidimicrobiales bacterium]
MAVLAAFSITPLGGDAVGDDGSVGAAVAEVVRLVRASGLANETNAMFTNVEGSWDDVMALIGRCVDHVAAAAPRVSVVVKCDVRPGASDALHAKVASVERHLTAPR